METPSPDLSHRNRARERHMRRKQQGMAQPAGVPRQLRPTGGFELPEIRMPGNRLILYGVAGAVFLVLVVMFIGRLKPDAPKTSPNALWIGTQWTYDNPDDTAITSLAQKLRDHQIGIVYAWVGLLQPNNVWSDTTKLDQVKSFVQRFKKLYPEVRLYGWLSIDAQPVDGSSRLGDANMQQIVSDFAQRMTGEFQFDGVMLNAVPVFNGDDNYLALLRKVRSSLGEDDSLSVAVPPDWTPADPDVPKSPRIEPGTVWDEAYKQRVALIADQIVITAYNSGLTSVSDYSTWIAYQVQTFAQAIIKLQSTTELIVGVPAYDAQLSVHDTTVENIQSAVGGIRDGMNKLGASSTTIKGIAVYFESQMTDADWSQLKALWAQ